MSETPPVPTTRDDLLIAALRCSNEMGGLLNDISAEVSRVAADEADAPKYERLYELLRRRFLENSAVHLFIAASNLGIELPEDLRGEAGEEAMID